MRFYNRIPINFKGLISKNKLWWCAAASKKCQFDIDDDCCNSMWKSPQDACDNFNFNNQCGSQIKSK